MARFDAQALRGRRIARTLPKPKVKRVKGVNVVVQATEGLTSDELRDLSEFYRQRYGRGSL